MGELLLARSAIHQALYQLKAWQAAAGGCLFIEFSQLDEMSDLVVRLEILAAEMEALEVAINA